MGLRESPFAAFYYRVVNGSVMPWLSRSRLTPNQLTLIGAAMALLVPPTFFWHPIAGLVAIFFSGVVDTLDGLVARAKDMSSDFGAFLDSTLDRVSDFLYLTGFWILFWKAGSHVFWATLLVYASVVNCVLISYTKARAEAVGAKCDVGFMDRGVRSIYLMALALAAGLTYQARVEVLWWGMGLFFALTLATVVQRVLHVRGELAGK